MLDALFRLCVQLTSTVRGSWLSATSVTVNVVWIRLQHCRHRFCTAANAPGISAPSVQWHLARCEAFQQDFRTNCNGISLDVKHFSRPWVRGSEQCCLFQLSWPFTPSAATSVVLLPLLVKLQLQLQEQCRNKTALVSTENDGPLRGGRI